MKRASIIRSGIAKLTTLAVDLNQVAGDARSTDRAVGMNLAPGS
jgi:hypothetical protein